MTHKILLIGDSCIDEYHYGICDRLSPEAPVPILRIARSEYRPGMAANVKINLESFGIEVDFITSETQSVKKRYIDDRSHQHIVRVDEDLQSRKYSLKEFEDACPKYDAIVISDYNKGFIEYDTISQIRQKFLGPIFIDTKKRNLSEFNGCFVKINNLEYDYATSLNDDLIVTMGEKGAMYKGDVFPAPKVDVTDVCGAGDTFLAALASEYLNTSDIRKAIIFANAASAISVQHNGVYALSQQDIDSIKNNYS